MTNNTDQLTLPAVTRQWSPLQSEIFDWFAKPTANRSLVVRARAGTGKTTTILEAINHAPERSILLCAFNKSIATELAEKIRNPRAEVKTLHALGFKFVARNWAGIKVDTKGARATRLALEVMGVDAPDEMIAMVKRLSGLGKEVAPLARGPVDLLSIAESFDCVPDAEWEEEGWTVERVAECAYRVMRLSASRDSHNEIDYSDMLFLPIVHRWIRAWFDMVVVDEAQDMNAAQLLIARGACRPGGRLVVVGDDRQAIYAFRGADAGSLDRMKSELRAVEKPLNVTYRCPRAVVALAAQLVPDYLAHPSAPLGSVTECPAVKVAELAAPGDFVLSRKNAPLAKVCLAILRRGVRAKIEGRDIGKGLIALVNKFRGRSMPEFLERLGLWEEREVRRAEAADRQEHLDQVRDSADTLRQLADGLSGVAELTARITHLFSDDNAGAQVVCSTVHKAKGREADRVFVLRDTLYPRKDRDGRPQRSPEEENIEYVAITRARAQLVMALGDL